MELADDIIERLQIEELLNAFMALPPSHQHEYIQWVDEAKQPDTRKRRIIAMCVLISEKSPA